MAQSTALHPMSLTAQQAGRDRTVFGPNWFATVMGTAIVAVVLAPHLPGPALAVWVVAAASARAAGRRRRAP